nr:hypothetical protein Iba_chr09aCG12360 [Ipomoea batatas]
MEGRSGGELRLEILSCSALSINRLPVPFKNYCIPCKHLTMSRKYLTMSSKHYRLFFMKVILESPHGLPIVDLRHMRWHLGNVVFGSGGTGFSFSSSSSSSSSYWAPSPTLLNLACKRSGYRKSVPHRLECISFDGSDIHVARIVGNQATAYLLLIFGRLLLRIEICPIVMECMTLNLIPSVDP